MRRGLFIVAATLMLIVLLLGLLLAALPARQVWSLLEPHTPQLQLAGISGPWWSGHAASVTWMGSYRGELNWHYQPPLALQFELTHAQLSVHATLPLQSISMSAQSLRLQALEVHMQASQLPQLWPQLQLQGQLQATLPLLYMQRNRVLSTHGEVVWTQARLAGDAAIDLGDISAQLQPQDNHSRMQISNRNSNDVNVQGSGVLYADRYQLQLRLRPKIHREIVRQQLALLTSQQADGTFLLNFQGRYE